MTIIPSKPQFIDPTLPGAELVQQGIDDLLSTRRTIFALLVLVARSRLIASGVIVPNVSFPEPEINLYLLLYDEYGDGAHSKYNALTRRLLSFINSSKLSCIHDASNSS